MMGAAIMMTAQRHVMDNVELMESALILEIAAQMRIVEIVEFAGMILLVQSLSAAQILTALHNVEESVELMAVAHILIAVWILTVNILMECATSPLPMTETSVTIAMMENASQVVLRMGLEALIARQLIHPALDMYADAQRMQSVTTMMESVT